MEEWIATKVTYKGQLDALDINDQCLTDTSRKQNNIKTIHTGALTYGLGVERYDLIYMRFALCLLVTRYG